MKNSDASEFSRAGQSTLSFKSLEASDLEAALLPFYLGLNFDARRARFGGAVSDEAIRRHCRQLDPDRAIVLACAGQSGLVAAIELHPISSDSMSSGWEDSELALADCATTDRKTIVAHLLQLAAFAAGKRGCRTFIIPSFSAEGSLLELLRGMGRVRVNADTVRVEIDEYADLHGRANSRL
jgi:hypothetical protein